MVSMWTIRSEHPIIHDCRRHDVSSIREVLDALGQLHFVSCVSEWQTSRYSILAKISASVIMTVL